MRESIKDVERAQEWGQVPLEEQLSLTERAEQHSRSSTGRRVCVRYDSLNPALAGVAKEKLLGCVPWDTRVLHCERSRLRMAVRAGLELKASPPVKGF